MRDIKFNKQRKDFSSFDWLPVSIAVCQLGADRSPANLINLDHSKSKFHDIYIGEDFFLKHAKDTSRNFLKMNAVGKKISCVRY